VPDRARGRRRPAVRALLATVLVAVLGGCTLGTQPAPDLTTGPSSTPTPTAVPVVVGPPTAAAVLVDAGADTAAAALQVSRELFVSAPVVVLAPVDDVAAQLTAASAAVALGAPLLLTAPAATPAALATTLPTLDPGIATAVARPTPQQTVPASGMASADPVPAELARLDTVAVLLVGAAPAPAGLAAVRVRTGADAEELAGVTGLRFGPTTTVAAGGEPAAVRALSRPATAVLVVEGAPAPTTPPPTPRTSTVPNPLASPTASRAPGLPAVVPPDPPAGTVALTGVGADPIAATACLRAAGVPFIDVPAGDPRASSQAVTALAAAAPTHVVALGAAFGPADRLAARVASAATGVQLPGGGQLVFPQDAGRPGVRYVALYGTPGTPALGVLGEQDVPATVARAQAQAAAYQPLTADTVVPAVELIATIASAGAGPDGNYSDERAVADLRPLVEAAQAAGQLVVLDLQPGRTDFLTQAQLYADLLALPNVGLALDPEWRLAPDQVHLRQIGTVGIDEVNAVADWLATFTRERHLPQKLFVLHQFTLRMIGDRQRLDTTHDELALMIHVDGQGGQPAKAGTWRALRTDAPPVHWGWKNFIDEDKPMIDPAQTYAVQPVPDLVTYQ